MIFNKSVKIDTTNSELIILNVVSDASLTSYDIANGKTVPLIILDTTMYPEIEQALVLQSTEYGRVNTLWGRSNNYKYIIIKFDFTEPVQMQFIVPFDIVKQSGLIDLIINSQLLYIQAGKPNDRLKNTMKAKRILIEVPSTEFAKEWIRIYKRVLSKHFRRQGLSKKKANKATDDLYEEWGKIRNFRLK